MKVLFTTLFIMGVQTKTTIMHSLCQNQENNVHKLFIHQQIYNLNNYQRGTPKYKSEEQTASGVIRKSESIAIHKSTVQDWNHRSWQLREQNDDRDTMLSTQNNYHCPDNAKGGQPTSVGTPMTPVISQGVPASNPVSTTSNEGPFFKEKKTLPPIFVLLLSRSLRQSEVKDHYKSAVQILPSQLPTPIEKLVQRIQNYFSTYNHPEFHNKPLTPPVTTDIAPDTHVEPTTQTAIPELEEYTRIPTEEIITDRTP